MKKLLLLAALAMLVTTSAFGQSAGLGGISGLVQDASGAAVPGATVIVANESKGIRRELSSNSQGVFNAPALIPDSGYHVTVSKSGFANFEAKNISISVGQTVDLRIDMSVAAAATQVDVSATAQLVENTKTDVSEVIGQRQILDLPTNGRRVDNFVLGTPGVSGDGAFGL